MTRYYNLTVWYKHNINEGFIKEHYKIITENILNNIKARYEKGYMDGDYAALKIEYVIVQ